jgi:hypothetical protein
VDGELHCELSSRSCSLSDHWLNRRSGLGEGEVNEGAK